MAFIEEIVEDNSPKGVAEKLKEEGNAAFVAKNFELACDKFGEALEICPMEELRLLAILFANRAACLVRLEDMEGALEDCHAAIEADPTYARGYSRRSSIYEAQNNFHDALADLKKAHELDEKMRKHQAADLKKLEEKSQKQFEKEKDEVVGKMKDFGNFILGKFGMSLDNFKVEQNKDTGAYSVNFQQNASEQANNAPSNINFTMNNNTTVPHN